MHDHKLDLAFDKICEANKKKSIPRSDIEAMHESYSIFEKKLEKWQPDIPLKSPEALKTIFILAPPRSGKSQLEKLLSRSELVKPLSDAIELQRNSYRLTFEKLVFFR